uniref:Uncharacterized protein n=1 Tax=Rhizophora mucronata TaxID=61149 RepID=A0A2P2QPL4_RHIMU
METLWTTTRIKMEAESPMKKRDAKM